MYKVPLVSPVDAPPTAVAEGFVMADVHVVPSVERSTMYPVWVTSVGAVHVRFTCPLPDVPDNSTEDTTRGVPETVELSSPTPAALMAAIRNVYG